MVIAVAGLTQTGRILRHLSDYGSITPVEAFEQYGIMRLGARIWDIKQLGYNVIATTEKAVNRYGEPVHYARYTLKKEVVCR